MHSLLAVDEKDRPLTGVLTWADDRAAPQALAARNNPVFDQLYGITGCPVHWMYPLYKILWLREERPDLFQAARRFVSGKEYICRRLCGEWVVDYSIASGTGLLNVTSHGWEPAALELAGIEPGQLSPLRPPRQALERLEAGLARRMGLLPEVPFILGSSDAANSSLGTGAGLPWEATCMIGTSGALRVISPHPVLGAARRNWCYALDEKHWLVGGAINNGGIALAWLQDTLNGAFRGLGEVEQLSFEDILHLAAESEPGAGGLICLPFLAGERSPNWNLNARGALVGLTLAHDARHLARALLEGIAFRFRSLDEMLAEAGVELRRVRASGGFTRSDFWLQLMSDVLGRELSLPLNGESSALGSAFWAMGLDGPCGVIEQLDQWAPVSRTFQPDLARASAYDRLYPLFGDLYRAIAPHFEPIARFQASE
jgi:gluconokinase